VIQVLDIVGVQAVYFTAIWGIVIAVVFAYMVRQLMAEHSCGIDGKKGHALWHVLVQSVVSAGALRDDACGRPLYMHVSVYAGPLHVWAGFQGGRRMLPMYGHTPLCWYLQQWYVCAARSHCSRPHPHIRHGCDFVTNACCAR
jgi:hypothetical protein